MYTIRYTGNRYAGRIDDGTRPIPRGVSVFEATGPQEAFHIIEGRYADHVKVVDRDKVNIKEYQRS